MGREGDRPSTRSSNEKGRQAGVRSMGPVEHWNKEFELFWLSVQTGDRSDDEFTRTC